MNMIAFLAALFLALITLGSAAFAQGQECGPRDEIVARLTGTFGETMRNLGLDQNNSIIEVYASDSTGTWTILVTMPTGLSCLVAAGGDWEVMVADAGSDGDPA